MSKKRTWIALKTAAIEAAGDAWDVTDGGDPRYITFTDPKTLRTVQAYHADGATVVCGATVSLREAAARLEAELMDVYGFGLLGSFTRLRALAPPLGQHGRPEIGRVINVRIPDQLLDAIDAEAGREDVPRAECIRRILYIGLSCTPNGAPSGLDGDIADAIMQGSGRVAD